jgi:DNA-binding LacI/PurR family transcriptional regulator
LGYAPDPMLSALAIYRESRRPRSFHGTIAYLANHSCESECLASPQSGDPLVGARERAAALGYSLRFFPLKELLNSPERFWRRLRNQGIHGVLMRSFPFPPESLPRPPEGFHCIDLFSQPHSSALPTVSSNHSQSMDLALQHLKNAGFQRPALILNSRISEILHHGWRMTFAASLTNFKSGKIFVHDGFPIKKTAFEEFISKHRPDTLVFCYSEDRMPPAKFLSQWHRRGIAAVCMDLLDPHGGTSGIYQDRKWAGSEALSLLHGMLMTGGMGAVRLPTATLIPGVWVEGRGLLDKPR